MTRKAATQWEFGELFEKKATRQVWSVTQITGKIRELIEGELGNVWVSGEATNVRLQSSGHAYFTLKDASAQLSCVLFRADAPRFKREMLKEGLKLNVRGQLSVYETRGQYQLVAAEIELEGQGALQIAFERLKATLQAEGLFDVARKRQIPLYPQRIGIITSPTGAALHDVLHVLRRRHPSIELIIRPSRVQGDGAAAEIAHAIVQLNDFNRRAATDEKLDCILLTRGGGSLEDLWAFNEETVARAIFASDLPIISAVGHEIDFTISDFVADLRAATPSAAAELLTNGIVAARTRVTHQSARLRVLVRQGLEDAALNVERLGARLGRFHPRRRLQEQGQHLDELQTQLIRCTQKRLRDLKLATTELAGRLSRTRPTMALARRRELVERLQLKLREAAADGLAARRYQVERLTERLQLLSPKAVLKRGYSITVQAETGQVVREAAQIQEGARIRTILSAGELTSKVESRSDTKE